MKTCANFVIFHPMSVYLRPRLTQGAEASGPSRAKIAGDVAIFVATSRNRRRGRYKGTDPWGSLGQRTRGQHHNVTQTTTHSHVHTVLKVLKVHSIAPSRVPLGRSRSLAQAPPQLSSAMRAWFASAQLSLCQPALREHVSEIGITDGDRGRVDPVRHFDE